MFHPKVVWEIIPQILRGAGERLEERDSVEGSFILNKGE